MISQFRVLCEEFGRLRERGAVVAPALRARNEGHAARGWGAAPDAVARQKRSPNAPQKTEADGLSNVVVLTDTALRKSDPVS